MVKVKFGVASKKRRKRVLKKAKGQFGGRSKLFRTAKESVQKGMAYAYRDRKQKKRIYRGLWISRINAGCKAEGFSYSKLIKGLKIAKVTLDRKMMAELAMHDTKAFHKLVELAKSNV